MDPTLQQGQTVQPPSSGDSRTTHVVVAPQINSGAGRPVVGPDATGSTPDSQANVSVRTAPAAATPQPTGPQINWGQVAKGVAIVAGVVLVGVVGAWLLSSAVPMIMSTPLGAQVMTGLATGAHTVLDIGAGVGEIAFSSLTTAASGFGAGLGIPAITSTAPFLWVSSTMGSIAAWIGGIGATLMALPHAMHGLAGLHFMDPSAAITAAPAVPGGTEVAAAASVASTKANMISQHPTQNFHAPGHHDLAGGALSDPSDSLIDDGALQASNKAMKVVHHAAEESHEYRHQRNARNLLARTAMANRSWADRVGPVTPQPVASTRTPIQPRSVNYTDQAELEKQLQAQAEGSRA